VIPDLEIAGRLFSVIAAYCQEGFICWQLFERIAINNLSVESFLRNTLGPRLLPDDIVLCDHASIHEKYNAIDALNEISRVDLNSTLLGIALLIVPLKHLPIVFLLFGSTGLLHLKHP
jgi:hypothetical protein